MRATNRQCFATTDIEIPPSFCRKGATKTVRANDYVIGGEHRGRQLELCGTHLASVQQGLGIWTYTTVGGFKFYKRGELR